MVLMSRKLDGIETIRTDSFSPICKLAECAQSDDGDVHMCISHNSNGMFICPELMIEIERTHNADKNVKGEN